MSTPTKTRAQKAGKFLAIALFAFLMFFNIKFAVSDDSDGDINLSGLTLSISTNSSYAYEWEDPPGGGGGGGGANCGLIYSMCVDNCEEMAAGQAAGCQLFIWEPPIYQWCMSGVAAFLSGCVSGCYIGYLNCI